MSNTFIILATLLFIGVAVQALFARDWWYVLYGLSAAAIQLSVLGMKT